MGWVWYLARQPNRTAQDEPRLGDQGGPPPLLGLRVPEVGGEVLPGLVLLGDPLAAAPDHRGGQHPQAAPAQPPHLLHTPDHRLRRSTESPASHERRREYTREAQKVYTGFSPAPRSDCLSVRWNYVSFLMCKDRSTQLGSWHDEDSALLNRGVGWDAAVESQEIDRRETHDISESHPTCRRVSGNQRGRCSPSFLMRDSRVVGLIPSSVARICVPRRRRGSAHPACARRRQSGSNRRKLSGEDVDRNRGTPPDWRFCRRGRPPYLCQPE
jgi:hypothetical protein